MERKEEDRSLGVALGEGGGGGRERRAQVPASARWPRSGERATRRRAESRARQECKGIARDVSEITRLLLARR